MIRIRTLVLLASFTTGFIPGLLISAPQGEHFRHIRTVSFTGLPKNCFLEKYGNLYFTESHGGFYRLDPDGSMTGIWSNKTSFQMPPIPASASNLLLFTDDGQILTYNSVKRTITASALIGRPFLQALAGRNGTIYFITDDSILSCYDLKGGNAGFYHYIPDPSPSGLKLTNNRLFVQENNGLWFEFNPLNGERLASGENKDPKNPGDSDNGFFQDGTSLIGTDGTNRWVESDGLHEWLHYRFTRFKELLLAWSETGEMQIFRKKASSSRPVWKENWKRLDSPERKDSGIGFYYQAGTHSYALIQGRHKQVFQFDDINPDQLMSLHRTRLSPEGRTDCIVLYTDNRTMDYTGIILFTPVSQGTNFEFLPARFITIGDRIFDSLFVDLNGDKRKEMIIRKEMLPSMNRNLKKRVLVPDVYSLKGGQFVWDSVNFPDFYSREIISAQKLQNTRPFTEDRQNSLWTDTLASLIQLETTLITLNRQVQSLFSRNRDQENKKGLSLWFYKKGIEFFNKKWDNLALYTFRKALETDRGNLLAAYQVSQIYSGYGLHHEALTALKKADPRLMPYLDNQDYHVMREEIPDLVYEPGWDYRKMALALESFENGLFMEAVEIFKPALSSGAMDNLDGDMRRRVERKLAESCLNLNQNYKLAIELLKKLESAGPSRDIENMRRIAGICSGSENLQKNKK